MAAPAKRTEPAVAPVSVPPMEGSLPAAQEAEYSRPVAEVFKHPVVVVAIDIAPVLPIIVKALVVVVAVPATVVVAKYKLPPALRVTHCATPAPSVRAVDDATVRRYCGVVVPMPTLPLANTVKRVVVAASVEDAMENNGAAELFVPY